MDPVTLRLKSLRNRTSPKISVRKVAEALGIPASTYAAYEDPSKYKKPILPLPLAKQIADIFEPLGISRGETLELAGLTGALGELGTSQTNNDDEDWLEIRGSVEAGVWRAQSEWPAGECYLVRFGPSKYSRGQRFGIRMEGLSMNKTILPGSDLECLYVKFSPIPPKPGDLVIVERKAHDLVELTCKRLAMNGDEYVLLCESSEPEFQEAIPIGKPDNGDFTDNEISVVGIVLSAKLDLAPKDLSERRYRHH